MTQGSLNETQNPLDVAIEGAASFRCSGPTEPSPTRAPDSFT